jgi:hypothetical protein
MNTLDASQAVLFNTLPLIYGVDIQLYMIVSLLRYIDATQPLRAMCYGGHDVPGTRSMFAADTR